MGTGGRVAAAVATGYLLGRTKKLKLAITVGSMMAGKRLATNPRDILRQASEYVDNNEQLAPLADQVRGSLLDAGRNAAVSVASNRLEAFSDSLRERSDQWRELPSSDDEDEGERDDEERDDESEAEADDERDTEGDVEAEEEAPPAESKSSSKKSSSKTSSAKKPTSKSSSTKSTSKSTSSKKSTTKKAPANKSTPKKQSPAKKSTSGRSRSSKARS